MVDFKYTPDDEVKIHPAGIDLICRPFQSHETGLPEWAKNAADAYGREECDSQRRIIVILLSDKRANGGPRIGCLDFVGTESEAIDTHFRHWASPDAATQGANFVAQGGHGNGGKCYMTMMFKDYAVFHTVRGNKGSKYGVVGGSHDFGYVPDASKGKDYEVTDLAAELELALSDFGMTLSEMPKAAMTSLSGSEGFTLVSGVGAKHYDGKLRAKDLMSQVRDHSQMITTLEFCDVYVLYNGKLLPGCNPVKPSDIKPIKGADAVREIEIPALLNDPNDGSEHSTIENGQKPQGKLRLFTSRTNMQYRKKARHIMTYRTSAGFIGYRSMIEFSVQSAYQDKIYGECELEALEQYKEIARRQLAGAPLTRAVEAFIASQIEAYAQEFEAKERQLHTKKEKNALSRMNERLDRWKNKFLKDLVQASLGPGSKPDTPPLPVGIPKRIEIRSQHLQMGIGVAMRPRIFFYDANDKRISPVPYRWVSEDPNVAAVDEDLMIINSFSAGGSAIYAETMDETLQSNRVPLQVLRIRLIRIEPSEVELYEGGRIKLTAVCQMSNGEESSDIALVWALSSDTIARVSANGMVFGAAAGETEVIAGDDNTTSSSATIKVIEGKEEDPKKKGSKKGKGYPQILVSGIDRDPFSDEIYNLTEDHPPVYQRPADATANIYWLNSSAPLAKMFLDKGLGYGYESVAWRMYHLERYADIITQIAVKYDSQIPNEMHKDQYFTAYADKACEIQAAMAADLADFINDGTDPLI